jgi:hypothetical protein
LIDNEKERKKDNEKERKKKCDSNSQTNLKGTTLLSDSEMAQKSRDSIECLVGSRHPGSYW